MVLLQFDDQRAEVLFQNVIQYVVYILQLNNACYVIY